MDTRWLFFILSILLNAGCLKTVYIPAYTDTSVDKELLAKLYTTRSAIRITSANGKQVPEAKEFTKAIYLIAPIHQRIGYMLEEDTDERSYYDPVWKEEVVFIPSEHFEKSGQIWLTPDPGKSYQLLVNGTPPHWEVRIEESDTGAIASGTKKLGFGFWTNHTVTRKCSDKFCSDWLIEVEFLDGEQNCKLVDRNTNKTLRSCKGNECQAMGICY